MMNFVSNCDTISSFFGNRKQTMSLTSKFFILINVLQSLRLIKDYEVVHMDLSPGNILVSQNYIPQLIDFGQSYSKAICEKGTSLLIQRKNTSLATLCLSLSHKNSHIRSLHRNQICFPLPFCCSICCSKLCLTILLPTW